jgi:hypothetical protein
MFILQNSLFAYTQMPKISNRKDEFIPILVVLHYVVVFLKGKSCIYDRVTGLFLSKHFMIFYDSVARAGGGAFLKS